MDSLTRQQVRAIDRCAIEQWGVCGLVLMENAGRQAADLAAELLGPLSQGSVAIVAGGGNNGGDGFVIARHLDLRGIRVAVYLVAARSKLTADADANLQILARLAVPVRDVAEAELGSLARTLAGADLVVDALGGTGITGALRGSMAEAVRQINAADRPVLAVDIPTGLNCDTGRAGDPTVRATATVTFVARKRGFDAPESATYTGRVVVADIGIPIEAINLQEMLDSAGNQ